MVSPGLIRNIDKCVTFWPCLTPRLWSLEAAFSWHSGINVYTKLPTETIGFTLFTLSLNPQVLDKQVMAWLSPVDTKTQ